MTSRGSSTWSRRGKRSSQTHDDLRESLQKEAIRELDMRNALEFYGVRFNQHGAAMCPFHKETDGSFRVKNRYWHCFGCSETGDLIKFVRKLFGLSYADALQTIVKDFALSDIKPTRADQERLDHLRIERYNIIHRYDELLKTRDICTDMYLLAYDAMCDAADDGGVTLDNERYVTACFNLLRARTLLDDAEYACAEYLKANPVATPVTPKHDITVTHGIILPPAPMNRSTSRENMSRAHYDLF